MLKKWKAKRALKKALKTTDEPIWFVTYKKNEAVATANIMAGSAKEAISRFNETVGRYNIISISTI